MKHKTISYPSIQGEFITLMELSRLAKINYLTLYFYQMEINLIPSFQIEGLKNKRFKKVESLQVLERFKELRATKKSSETFLRSIQKELLQEQEYIDFMKLAEQHANEINSKNG